MFKMKSVSNTLMALIKIIPTAWVILGFEYQACWWESMENLYELVMSILGALLISFVLIFVGEWLCKGEKAFENEEEEQESTLSVKSCIKRIAGEIFVLAFISALLDK